jgi:hypothetical protein
MPLEGHWQRQNTPLRSLGRRELLAILAAVAVVAAIVVVAVTASGGSSPAQAGCIDVTIPSTTGGARVHACGAEAKRFCAEDADRGTTARAEVRRQCRRLEP